MNKLLIGILLVAVFSGCVDEVGFTPHPDYEETFEVVELGRVDVTGISGYTIKRFHDSDKNVTCWVTTGTTDAMSCLHDEGEGK
jgi:hypothetical protein